MKRLTVPFLLVFASSALANPYFTIGSNPFYTFLGFPHDILRWPSKAVFFYVYPQTLPWQGNVTNITDRPNDTYISNYSNFDFPVPDGYAGNPSAVRSYMHSSGYAYNNRYSAGAIWNYGDWGKVYAELGTNRVDLELQVDGVVRNNNTLELIPVSAQTNAARRYYDLQMVYANYLFGNPFGLRVQYQTIKSSPPESQISFVRNGAPVTSNHLTWGWTTSPCAHIFHMTEQNFDAWFLNDYTLYRGGQLDLQLSYEQGDTKSAIRFRRLSERGQHYYWQSTLPDSIPESNFDGFYFTDSRYQDAIANDLIRAYSKIRLWKFGDAEAGLLFFLQYADRDNSIVSSEQSVDTEPLSNDAENEYTLEINPWVNYRFGKSYFDFGLLCELSTVGMENTSPRWNGVAGATQYGVIMDSSPYTDGFSPSWETFSRGRNTALSFGIEASSAINISGRFSALASLLLLRKFSFIRKDYGSSTITGGSSGYVFNPSSTRHDYKNETWMTGSIGISYGFGPAQILASMNFPLAYLLTKTTELADSGTTLVDLTQRNVWAVQEPVSFRLLVVFGLER